MTKKMDETTKEGIKVSLGYTEEQIEIIEGKPKLMGILEKFPTFLEHKLVITCVTANNCAFNKVGDKYVFNGFGGMIKSESCETPCLWAMSRFMPFSFMVYDRIASGLNPNDMHLDSVACPDTGCHHGGFGNAVFKVTVEKI